MGLAPEPLAPPASEKLRLDFRTTDAKPPEIGK